MEMNSEIISSSNYENKSNNLNKSSSNTKEYLSKFNSEILKNQSNNDKKEEFIASDQISNLESLFFDDKFDDALILHAKIKAHLHKELLETVKKSLGESCENNSRMIDNIVNSKIENLYKENVKDKRIDNLKLIMDEDEFLLKTSQDVLKEVNSKVPEREHAGIKSWFFYNDKISTITLCNRCNVKAPLLHILSVLAEIDLMKNFVKSLNKVEKCGDITMFRFILKIEINLPLTISNREMIGFGIGSIDKSTKSILMPFKSINPKLSSYCSVPVPPEGKSYKRIYVEFGFFNLTVVNENECEITQCINVNPKVSYIPLFVINKILKEISYYMTAEFKTQIEKSVNDEVYPERRKKNPIFYEKLINELSKLD
jgi:hypothetical protein